MTRSRENPHKEKTRFELIPNKLNAIFAIRKFVGDFANFTSLHETGTKVICRNQPPVWPRAITKLSVDDL